MQNRERIIVAEEVGAPGKDGTPVEAVAALFLQPLLKELRAKVEAAVTRAGFKDPQEILLDGRFVNEDDGVLCSCLRFCAISAIRVDEM